ncbi:MAG: hypothetical protein RRB13_06720 [bacterium]|nr:hypothetical protein [bacterium]
MYTLFFYAIFFIYVAATVILSWRWPAVRWEYDLIWNYCLIVISVLTVAALKIEISKLQTSLLAKLVVFLTVVINIGLTFRLLTVSDHVEVDVSLLFNSFLPFIVTNIGVLFFWAYIFAQPGTNKYEVAHTMSFGAPIILVLGMGCFHLTGPGISENFFVASMTICVINMIPFLVAARRLADKDE